MSFNGHNHNHEPGANEADYPPSVKDLATHISHTSTDKPGIELEGGNPARRVIVAPQWIRDLTPEQRVEIENKLKTKIDFRLLPMVILMYIMNYLDRNNIAAARLAGLEDDLNLTSVQYSTSVSILFVGYLLMQVPSNLFLNKVGKPGVYLPCAMMLWGIISTATAACQSYAGLVSVRFFLGFVEAAYFPGCLYYLSCWYTRKELGLRTAILYSGSLISGAFSGLIAAAITGNMDGLHGLRAWRWLFIIEGTITIGVAAASYFILPNFPRTTKWLTEQERELAVWRLEEDIGEDDWVDSEQQSFFQGAKLALLDPKMWILCVMLLGVVSSGSVTNFFPTVVETLGFNKIKSLLLTAPPYILCVITAFANARHADATGERFLHIVLPLTVAMVAFILAACTTALAPRYLSMMLMLPGIYTAFVIILAWISNTLPRPPAKRAAALAIINAISNCSSIYASYMYPESAGPRYITAMSVNCATCFLAILMATLLRLILVRENKKLDLVFGTQVNGAAADEGVKKGFRYRV